MEYIGVKDATRLEDRRKVNGQNHGKIHEVL
jgi:hypothetical protein